MASARGSATTRRGALVTPRITGGRTALEFGTTHGAGAGQFGGLNLPSTAVQPPST
ncbi:hypothetical protein [Nonomuraea africana]|uniref:Uncharacterized protein n=1 Tax=Nonomuraea africana TaxID=46171 RepID=A0ABR9KBM4_9ACTN|nr:hypothetical protein [Nonomuraea africana]MBE1559415.1 hypothetical protein [Nonomuraea africana]